MEHKENEYNEYLQTEIRLFENEDAWRRSMLLDALDNSAIKTVLDVGCGAGQEMLPFTKLDGVYCIGIDIAPEIGEIGNELFMRHGVKSRVAFVRSVGESLPFADKSVDVVICRVALPLMDNKRTISEIARVLSKGGVFFLKFHAPAFYLWLLRRRIATLNPKQIAYPLICVAGSTWYLLTGLQLLNGFWKGKEVFRTIGSLKRDLATNNLRVEKMMPDSTVQAPSFKIVKN